MIPNYKVLFLVIATSALLQLVSNTPMMRAKRKAQNGKCDCVCGMNNRQMRIVGGNNTKIHEFPWMAGIHKEGNFHCGATLITKRHVLTAAHCVYGFNMADFNVMLADHDHSSEDRLSKVVIRNLVNIREHDGYDSFTKNNDIAILELDKPVKFDYKVQPACLPKTGAFKYSGKLAVVAGWGRVAERDKTSDVLKKVEIPVWNKKDCYDSYGDSKISENMFCAGYPDGMKDACSGDSGGPILMPTNGKMEVIGIVSWGRGCARPHYPGVYTKLTNYLDWVDETLDGECLCSPQI